MSTDRTKGLAKPRKRRPQARIRTINRAHAAQIREIDERNQDKRLYPEPEPKGRYMP